MRSLLAAAITGAATSSTIPSTDYLVTTSRNPSARSGSIDNLFDSNSATAFDITGDTVWLRFKFNGGLTGLRTVQLEAGSTGLSGVDVYVSSQKDIWDGASDWGLRHTRCANGVSVAAGDSVSVPCIGVGKYVWIVKRGDGARLNLASVSLSGNPVFTQHVDKVCDRDYLLRDVAPGDTCYNKCAGGSIDAACANYAAHDHLGYGSQGLCISLEECQQLCLSNENCGFVDVSDDGSVCYLSNLDCTASNLIDDTGFSSLEKMDEEFGAVCVSGSGASISGAGGVDGQYRHIHSVGDYRKEGSDDYRVSWDGCAWSIQQRSDAADMSSCTDDVFSANVLFGNSLWTSWNGDRTNSESTETCSLAAASGHCGNAIIKSICQISCNARGCGLDSDAAADAWLGLVYGETGDCSDLVARHDISTADAVVSSICSQSAGRRLTENTIRVDRMLSYGLIEWHRVRPTPSSADDHKGRRLSSGTWDVLYTPNGEIAQCGTSATPLPDDLADTTWYDYQNCNAAVSLSTSFQCDSLNDYETNSYAFCAWQNIPRSTIVGGIFGFHLCSNKCDSADEDDCDGYENDDASSDAICADRETCEEICTALGSDCQGVDMVRGKRRCHLNGRTCSVTSTASSRPWILGVQPPSAALTNGESYGERLVATQTPADTYPITPSKNHDYLTKRSGVNAWNTTSYKFCPSNNIEITGSLADDLCVNKCATLSAHTDNDMSLLMCSGYFSSVAGGSADGLSSHTAAELKEALCLPREQCEAACWGLDNCYSFDMHTELPRCWLNTNACDDDTEIVDANYHDHVVKFIRPDDACSATVDGEIFLPAGSHVLNPILPSSATQANFQQLRNSDDSARLVPGLTGFSYQEQGVTKYVSTSPDYPTVHVESPLTDGVNGFIKIVIPAVEYDSTSALTFVSGGTTTDLAGSYSTYTEVEDGNVIIVVFYDWSGTAAGSVVDLKYGSDTWFTFTIPATWADSAPDLWFASSPLASQQAGVIDVVYNQAFTIDATGINTALDSGNGMSDKVVVHSCGTDDVCNTADDQILKISSVSDTNNMLHVTMVDPLVPNTFVEVTVGAGVIASESDTSLFAAKSAHFHFQTFVDVKAPEVVLSLQVPAANAEVPSTKLRNILVAFDEAVSCQTPQDGEAGVFTIDGDTYDCSAVSIFGSKAVLSFTTSLAAGNHNFDLCNSCFADGAGRWKTGASSATFTASDSYAEPVQVIWTSVSGTAAVEMGHVISVFFNEAVLDDAGLATIVLENCNGDCSDGANTAVGVTGTLTNDSTLNLKAGQLQANGKYRLTIPAGSVTNAAGGRAGPTNDFVVEFATSASDSGAEADPRITTVGSFPQSGTTVAPGAPIVVAFTEAIATNGGAVKIDGSAVTVLRQVSNKLLLTAPSSAGTYTVTLDDNAYTDLAGNGFVSASSSFVFTVDASRRLTGGNVDVLMSEPSTQESGLGLGTAVTFFVSQSVFDNAIDANRISFQRCTATGFTGYSMQDCSAMHGGASAVEDVPFSVTTDSFGNVILKPSVQLEPFSLYAAVAGADSFGTGPATRQVVEFRTGNNDNFAPVLYLGPTGVVGTTSSLVFGFSEPVECGSGNVVLTDSAAFSATYACSVLHTLSPNSLVLYATLPASVLISFTLQDDFVRDLVGNPIQAVTSTFYTNVGADEYLVVHGSSYDATTAVAKFYLSENIDATESVQAMLEDASGSSTVLSCQLDAVGIVSVPNLDLTENEVYTLALPAFSVRTASGNTRGPYQREVLTFTAGPDKVAPTIASSFPVHAGTTTAGSSIKFMFSEPVVCPDNGVTLSIGPVSSGNLNIACTDAKVHIQGSSVVVTLPDGVSYLDGNQVTVSTSGAGWLADAAGNLAPQLESGDYTFTYLSSVDDETPPQYILIEPASGSTNVQLAPTFSFYLSERVQVDNVMSLGSYCETDSAGVISSNCQQITNVIGSNTKYQVSITEELKKNQNYKLTLSPGVFVDYSSAASGTNSAGPTTVLFATGEIDNAGPKMAADASDVYQNGVIELHFHEPVDCVSDAAIIKFFQTAAYESDITSLMSNAVAVTNTVTCAQAAIQGSVAYVPVASGLAAGNLFQIGTDAFEDLSGNAMPQSAVTSTFTVLAEGADETGPEALSLITSSMSRSDLLANGVAILFNEKIQANPVIFGGLAGGHAQHAITVTSEGGTVITSQATLATGSDYTAGVGVDSTDPYLVATAGDQTVKQLTITIAPHAFLDQSSSEFGLNNGPADVQTFTVAITPDPVGATTAAAADPGDVTAPTPYWPSDVIGAPTGFTIEIPFSENVRCVPGGVVYVQKCDPIMNGDGTQQVDGSGHLSWESREVLGTASCAPTGSPEIFIDANTVYLPSISLSSTGSDWKYILSTTDTVTDDVNEDVTSGHLSPFEDAVGNRMTHWTGSCNTALWSFTLDAASTTPLAVSMVLPGTGATVGPRTAPAVILNQPITGSGSETIFLEDCGANGTCTVTNFDVSGGGSFFSLSPSSPLTAGHHYYISVAPLSGSSFMSHFDVADQEEPPVPARASMDTLNSLNTASWSHDGCPLADGVETAPICAEIDCPVNVFCVRTPDSVAKSLQVFAQHGLARHAPLGSLSTSARQALFASSDFYTVAYAAGARVDFLRKKSNGDSWDFQDVFLEDEGSDHFTFDFDSTDFGRAVVTDSPQLELGYALPAEVAGHTDWNAHEFRYERFHTNASAVDTGFSFTWSAPKPANTAALPKLYAVSAGVAAIDTTATVVDNGTDPAESAHNIYSFTVGDTTAIDFAINWDVDECSDASLNNCHEDAVCTNTVGSYTCACVTTTHYGDGLSCSPKSEDMDFVLEVSNGQELVTGWHVQEITLFGGANCASDKFESASISPSTDTFENHPAANAVDGVLEQEAWTKFSNLEVGEASFQIPIGSNFVRSLRVQAHAGFASSVYVHLSSANQVARTDGSHLVNRVAGTGERYASDNYIEVFKGQNDANGNVDICVNTYCGTPGRYVAGTVLSKHDDIEDSCQCHRLCLNRQPDGCVAWRAEDGRNWNWDTTDTLDHHVHCILLSDVQPGQAGRKDHIYSYISHSLELLESVVVPTHSPGASFTASVHGHGFLRGDTVAAKHQALKPVPAVISSSHGAKFNTICEASLPHNVLGTTCVEDTFCASHVSSSSMTQLDFERFRIFALANDVTYNWCVCTGPCYLPEHWAVAPGSYTVDASDYTWSSSESPLTRFSGDSDGIISLSVTSRPGVTVKPAEWNLKLVKVDADATGAVCETVGHPGFLMRSYASDQRITFNHDGDTRSWNVTFFSQELFRMKS